MYAMIFGLLFLAAHLQQEEYKAQYEQLNRVQKAKCGFIDLCMRRSEICSLTPDELRIYDQYCK